MKKRFLFRKLNNLGMSFIELLTAIVILAIVSVPFLHSYLSSAKVNAKARVTLNGTTLCENVMEEFEAYDFSYLQGLIDAEGNPVFAVTVSGNDMTYTTTGAHYDESMADYAVTIHLDPKAKSEYETFNNQNVTDLQEFKANACAVYSMLPEADSNAFRWFATKSTSKTEEYFRDNVKRDIQIKFDSLGNISIVEDGAEKLIKHVSIDVTVKYEIDASKSSEHGLSAAECKYEVSKNVYNNRNSQEEFLAMYLMYTPIFNAQQDTITIINRANIHGTTYVMREETTADNNAGVYNLSTYKGYISLEETPAWAVGSTEISGRTSAMRIRTNLFNDVPGTPNMTLKFEPKYVTAAHTFGVSGAGIEVKNLNDIVSLMQIQTADGRNFDRSANKDRIYGVTITISKDSPSNVISSLTGTITK